MTRRSHSFHGDQVVNMTINRSTPLKLLDKPFLVKRLCAKTASSLVDVSLLLLRCYCTCVTFLSLL